MNDWMLSISSKIESQLKEEIAEYKEDVEQLKEIAQKSEVRINVKESAAAKRLLKKVDAMISKLDKVMENLEKEKKLQADKPEDKTKEELVRIDEVMNAVRKVSHSKCNWTKLLRKLIELLFLFFFCCEQMQKATDQSKMDQISSFLERIDDDQDGHLKVDDVLKVSQKWPTIAMIGFSQFKIDAPQSHFSISDNWNNWKREH